MTKDDKDIVAALCASLVERVGPERYELWFGPPTELAVRGGKLTVSAPNRFAQDWLRTQFRKELEAACIDACGAPLALEFRVQHKPALPATLPLNPPAPAAESRTSAPIDANTPSTTAGDVAGAPINVSFPLRRYAALGDLVVGDSNCLAFKSAQMTVENPGQYSPLFLHGPTGVGKTHIAEGIFGGFRRQHRSARAMYLTAEQFTSYFLEALRGSGLPSFRRKYRDLDLLVIDDVQFFANKAATLGELRHTIEPLLGGGRQLVLVADRSPSALKALGPEVAAKLSGAVVCRIDPPEHQTRLGIVRQLAEKMQLAVPDDVQAYIASHLTSHARELAGALKRLQATSLAHSRPITLALAEDALADLIHRTDRAVRLPDIGKAICEVFGLDGDSLQSNRKGKGVSHPRMLAMWLARKHTRSALSEIGHFFGRRSHSTVIAAHKKVERWMASGKALELDERSWKLEDAIRRVEEMLRAG